MMDIFPPDHWDYAMKTFIAREAKNAFGAFLDAAQRKPAMITKNVQPVGVMLPMNDVPAIDR